MSPGPSSGRFLLPATQGVDYGIGCVREGLRDLLAEQNLEKIMLVSTPSLAIPTTLSSAEYTFAVAITDELSGEKNLYADMKLTPRWVLQDPVFCSRTPSLL